LDRALCGENDRPFKKHGCANLGPVRRATSSLQAFQAVHRSRVR
jgi:hypothetical protein